MGAIIKIENFQRKIISILFRIVLTTYSIFLLLNNDTNFNWYINVLVIILYWVIFLLLWSKDGWKSLLRLTVDYLFIYTTLHQQSDFTFVEYSLLFIPILNCQNHSSNRRTILVYIYPLVITFLITNNLSIYYTLPFITFYLINSFEEIRTKYSKFIETLNSKIDDFFIQTDARKKTYTIYKELIPIINKSSLFKNQIDNIICFKIKNKRVKIINGSYFIWNLSLKNYPDFLKKLGDLEDSNSLYNIEITINKRTIKENLILVYEIDDSFYCYVIEPRKNDSLSDIRFKIFLPKLIKPFFVRLTKVFEADLILKAHNYEEIKKMAEKNTYVSKAELAMHHIRNHLTPFKNISALTNTLNKVSDPIIANKIIGNMKKDATTIQTSLPEILKRVDLILDKPQNPFNISDLISIGSQQLFTRIKNIWSFHFEDEEFEINWNSDKNRVRADVELNLEGLDLILSNWLSNVEKFSGTHYGVIFNENDVYYEVLFHNSYENKQKVNHLLELFNANDKSQVFRNTSHGIFQIKECLNQMKMSGEMYVEENTLFFTLKFKKKYI